MSTRQMVRPMELPTMEQSSIMVIRNNGHQGLEFILPKEMMTRDGLGKFFVFILPNFKVKN